MIAMPTVVAPPPASLGLTSTLARPLASTGHFDKIAPFVAQRRPAAHFVADDPAGERRAVGAADDGCGEHVWTARRDHGGRRKDPLGIDPIDRGRRLPELPIADRRRVSGDATDAFAGRRDGDPRLAVGHLDIIGWVRSSASQNNRQAGRWRQRRTSCHACAACPKSSERCRFRRARQRRRIAPVRRARAAIPRDGP